MTSNTLKTIFGFVGTLITKYSPFDFSKGALEEIYNYHWIDEQVATSGQPTEEQFNLIQQAGYQRVINLAPHKAENSLADEASLLGKLDIEYLHIPVDFKNPAAEDFAAFVAAMKNTTREKTWVHCAANMRVSAFIYKYRTEVLEWDIQAARADLEKIWTPMGIWKDFLSKD